MNASPAKRATADRRSFGGAHLWPPLAFSGSILLLAPFVGTILDRLKESMPRGLLLLFGAILGAAALVILVSLTRSILRDRARLWLRLALVAIGFAIIIAFLARVERGAMVGAQERLHFVLYGTLAWLFYRAYRPASSSWGRALIPMTALSTAAVGLLDEAVQAVAMLRNGEIYDVGLNTLATFCGVLIVLGIEGWPPFDQRASPEARRRLGWLATLTTLLFGVFFHYAHLGYRIEDPEIGVFYSYTAPDDFKRVNEQRASRWEAQTPGPPFDAFDLNDRFRVEAGWRTQHRNAQFRVGNAFDAYREHLILERYYPSFLDSGNLRGDDYRLPPHDLEALIGAVPETAPRVYVSPAGIVPKRIFARPSKGHFWILIAGTSIFILWLSRRRQDTS